MKKLKLKQNLLHWSISKLAEVIQSGGMAKWFLSEHEVFINGEQEEEKRKKTICR